jgi:8-oxo-dGTP pyrophosphatase MutT (NUDIX family)
MDSELQRFKKRVRAILAQHPRRILSDPPLVRAAVLIPLLFKEGGWHVLVTQRTKTVEHHKGQISFPGGACDPDDADLLATALRETYEEIGIPPELVEVLGALDDHPTITNFVITPFVGVIPHPFTYRPNGYEVEQVIEVPLAYLCDSANLRVEQWDRGQGQVYDLLCWDYGSYSIWGVTARILKSFLDLAF